MKSNDKRSIDWRSPHVVALLAAVAVAVVAVPAWAQSDDGLDNEFEAVPAPPGVTPRAAHAVPPPPGGPAAEIPAGVPGGAGQRDDFIVPAPPGVPGEAAPQSVPGGGPSLPPGGSPFPLSDQQIEAQREALQRFAGCMGEQGIELGEPEVSAYEIAIPLPEDGFSEEFEAAARKCGGPPPPPPPAE